MRTLGGLNLRIRLGAMSARNTNTAVISLRSLGFSPHRRATATSSRKSTAPMIAPEISKPSERLTTSAYPMMTLANPITMIPMPICTSAKP